MTKFSEIVKSTLSDPNMLNINFVYGPVKVYPNGYKTVAALIRHGHISFRISDDANAHYSPIENTWHVPSNIADVRNGEVYFTGALGAGVRKTIVHEATHALEDYQRLSDKLGSSFTPAMAEGAAYVAGWMAAINWGFQPVYGDRPPMRTANAIARWIASRFLPPDIVVGRSSPGSAVSHIPMRYVQELNARVLTGSHSLYQFRGF